MLLKYIFAVTAFLFFILFIIIILPVQIVSSIAQLFFVLLFLILTFFVLVVSIFSHEPLSCALRWEGQSYQYSDVPEKFSLRFTRENPILEEGRVVDYHPVPLLYVKISMGVNPLVEVQLKQGGVTLEVYEIKIGKPLTIPPETFKKLTGYSMTKPIQLQVRHV